jgi:hypothetical protein
MHRVLLASRNRLLKDRLEKLPKSSNVLDLQDVGLDFEVAEQVIIQKGGQKFFLVKFLLFGVRIMFFYDLE